MNFSVEKAIKLLRKNFILILAVALLMSAAMYYYTITTAVPIYTAYTELYVNTKATEGDKYLGIGAENSYSATYIEMLKTVKFCKVVYQGLSDEYKAMTSPAGVYGSLRVGSKNETAIITVRVASANNALAKAVAESAAHNASIYLNERFGVDNVEIVEDARISGVTAVDYKRNVIIGFIFGAFVSFFIVFVKDMYDYRIRSTEEISERYNLPVLGTVPTFDSKPGADKYAKKGYRYRYKYKYKR